MPVWTFETNITLAKNASQMYPFLFSILGFYYVFVYYLKTIVSQSERKIIRYVESTKISINQKKNIIMREYANKQIVNHVLYCWNAGLSIFSLMGAMHLFPEIIRKLQENEYRDYWCEPIYYYDSITLEWLSYFHLSKLLELGDTVFLVLRGKDPIFLHMYRHISVAVISWESMVQMPSHILTNACLNYFINFIMYLYFALQIYDRVPSWFRSYWITYMQIGQMVVGIFGSMETYYYILQENPLNNTLDNTLDNTALTLNQPMCSASQGFVAAGLLLYFSYLILFLDFYHNKSRVK